MRTDVAILVGVLVVLAGCLGGGGGATTTVEPTTDEATATGGGGAATTDAGATAEGGTATADAGETSERATATTTLPATTDAERNVAATFADPDGDDVTVSLMVADEPDERQRGLMYRQSLPNRTGMVFVYDAAAPRTFWMKNTYVPLDIVFVSANGTVLNVEHAQAQPHAPDSEVDRYSSEGDAKYVVELPRGFANRTGVALARS